MCIRDRCCGQEDRGGDDGPRETYEPLICWRLQLLSLIHISEPTRQAEISYAVFCLKKKTRPWRGYKPHSLWVSPSYCFFFNDTATTEIYTRSLVGSVRCV